MNDTCAVVDTQAGVGVVILICVQLTDYSLSCTKKNHGVLLTSGRASLQTVDGFKGLPEKGPFNAIHVGAAAPEIPPALVEQVRRLRLGVLSVSACAHLAVCLEQLAPGGRMFIPVGPDGGAQVIMQVGCHVCCTGWNGRVNCILGVHRWTRVKMARL